MRRIRCFAALSMTIGALCMTIMLAAFSACSVKEDRSDCPCWLTVRASFPNEKVSAWLGTRPVFEGLVGEQVDRKVPRGDVDIVTSRGSFTVHEGEQMDELFATLTRLDTRAEEMEIAPSLNKQFARVYLEFQDADDGRVDYTLEVQGNVKGADKRTLQPVGGPFRCTPDESSSRGYEVRVPRQKDDSLMLLQYDQDGKGLDPIPLGDLIKKAGFDWSRESLGDVSILANIPEMSFQITILDWEGPITMTVTI